MEADRDSWGNIESGGTHGGMTDWGGSVQDTGESLWDRLTKGGLMGKWREQKEAQERAKLAGYGELYAGPFTAKEGRYGYPGRVPSFPVGKEPITAPDMPIAESYLEYNTKRAKTGLEKGLSLQEIAEQLYEDNKTDRGLRTRADKLFGHGIAQLVSSFVPTPLSLMIPGKKIGGALAGQRAGFRETRNALRDAGLTEDQIDEALSSYSPQDFPENRGESGYIIEDELQEDPGSLAFLEYGNWGDDRKNPYSRWRPQG
uniref:Uncharacterized protein n=1 Tax=viral metagenome TaxID=1070528 RepID=A0A6M3KW41_9ZZZZ